MLGGLAAIGHDVRAAAIATRITLRDHIAPVRQHADGSSARMSGDPGAGRRRTDRSDLRASERRLTRPVNARLYRIAKVRVNGLAGRPCRRNAGCR